MRSSLRLLKIIGKAALHISGVGGLWSILMEDVPELANEVWNDWSQACDADERRGDLEALAQLLDDDISLDIDAILDEIATDRPEPVRAELAAFLSQIPLSVRQTLRRPADPSGRTVPPAMEPRSARDLIPFLDTQRPRFKRGDRPIPGVDWELDELLGIGGFGEVWKARHTQLDDFEPVALKFCTDPQARERLLKHEAKVCTRVMKDCHHSGIVQLRQAYLSADPPCLEYEYVEGGTLVGLIKEWYHREPRPSVEEVTRHLLAIAEIVAFAHRLDPPIVHRDLKPANILVQRTNGTIRLKITDFGIGGIATIRAIREASQPTRPPLLLTKAVSGSHSPIYASPEQALGGDPDPRDDVHALGVIWYQFLTGDLTARAPTGSAWKRTLRDQNMPPDLLDLLESCFDAAPHRPENAAALVSQLKYGLEVMKGDELAPETEKSEPSSITSYVEQNNNSISQTTSAKIISKQCNAGLFATDYNVHIKVKDAHFIKILRRENLLTWKISVIVDGKEIEGALSGYSLQQKHADRTWRFYVEGVCCRVLAIYNGGFYIYFAIGESEYEDFH